ncbi:MAG: LD-carboxypeptidase [Candidatus Moranbacteria bacterium]|nr:LD-carboxypeptidase [Candidatus Moranbacteria bacterium]
MNLINPEHIKKRQTIGIISPSAGLAPLFPHRIDNGKAMLEKMGFNVKFSSHALEQAGYVSALPEERAADINQMFADDNIKAIICSIGGNHSNQVLKYLDFEMIAKNPKIFLGYSDITVLHLAFAKKSRLRTFYGPCLMSEFGEFSEMLTYTREHFEKATSKTDPIGIINPSFEWTEEFLDWFAKKDLTRPRRLQKNKGYEWWKQGKTKGELWGGTIPSLNHLAGTEYWIDLKDKILFLDLPEGDNPASPLPLSSLDSYLSDMDNLGVFSSIKGLIIGRPYFYKPKDVETLKKYIEYYTRGCSYPILYNANIGHASPIITIPMGIMSSLNSEKNEFSILESGVS